MRTLARFWSANPALLFGLSLVFGIAHRLSAAWIWPTLDVILAVSSGKRFPVPLLLACSGFLFVTYYIQTPSVAFAAGSARVQVTEIKQEAFHNKLRWSLSGTLEGFWENGELIAQNIPFCTHLPTAKPRPEGGFSYLVKSKLRWSEGSRAYLSVSKDATWKPLSKHWSLAEWRWRSKQKLRNYLIQVIPHSGAGQFLSGLTTGLFDDKLLLMDFNRVGLGHILAISGFHFSILALILARLLYPIFPYRTAHCLLLASLSAYFLFVGPMPSIARAWIGASVASLASLRGRSCPPLNALGLAIIIIALPNPLVLRSLAFQFTFLATAGILLFTASFERLLERIFVPRPLKSIIPLGFEDRHLVVVGTYLRKTLALTLSVNLTTVPLVFYHFQRFPLLTLVYNLFYPLAVSFALFVLLCALLVYIVSPTAALLIHRVNSAFTGQLTDLVQNTPTPLCGLVHAPAFSLEALLCYYVVLGFLGAWMYQSRLQEEDTWIR